MQTLILNLYLFDELSSSSYGATNPGFSLCGKKDLSSRAYFLPTCRKREDVGLLNKGIES